MFFRPLIHSTVSSKNVGGGLGCAHRHFFNQKDLLPTTRRVHRRLVTLNPAQALIPGEYATNCHILPYRHVTTLSPSKFKLKHQQLVDLSGLPEPIVRIGDKHTKMCFTKRLPFPNKTVGVFHYVQSMTSPTSIGELRFRVCDTVDSFARGSDLLLPSGLPWCVNSEQILQVLTYAPLHNLLLGDGLLKELPFPKSGKSIVHLSSFSQPFVLNLESQYTRVNLWTGAEYEQRRFFWDRKSGDYRVRAVVRLEHPSETNKFLGRDKPLAVLRILELLTPIIDLEKSKASIFRPEAGQLLHNHVRRAFRPWGLRVRKERYLAVWAKFITQEE